MVENYIGVPEWQDNSIDFNGNVDTYAVWLTGGQSYSFDAIGWGETAGNGDGWLDPTLTVSDAVYDWNWDLVPNTTLAFNDDVNYPSNLDSHIDFTAGADGYYILSVAGYGNETGDYTLETSYQPSFANDVVLVPV
jgi:serralysin